MQILIMELPLCLVNYLMGYKNKKEEDDETESVYRYMYWTITGAKNIPLVNFLNVMSYKIVK